MVNSETDKGPNRACRDAVALTRTLIRAKSSVVIHAPAPESVDTNGGRQDVAPWQLRSSADGRSDPRRQMTQGIHMQS